MRLKPGIILRIFKRSSQPKHFTEESEPIKVTDCDDNQPLSSLWGRLNSTNKENSRLGVGNAWFVSRTTYRFKLLVRDEMNHNKEDMQTHRPIHYT